MGYISKIDRRATIRAAKKELNDFAELLTLFKTYGEVSSVDLSKSGLDLNFVNYDSKMLQNIEVKDEREREIEEVLTALNALDPLGIEVIWMKHINKKTVAEMCEQLNIGESTLYRRLNDTYVAFAIAYGISKLKK